MKNKITFTLSLFFSLFLTGCIESRYLTERYVKTNIEQHKEGNFSSIKILSIFQGVSDDRLAYMEFTGCKYDSNKVLVIGFDKDFMKRKKLMGRKVVEPVDMNYIQVTVSQVKNILDDYKTLQDKIRVEKPVHNEEIFHDLTVSPDFFISYKKPANVTYLWMRGERFEFKTSKLISQLQKFMKY